LRKVNESLKGKTHNLKELNVPAEKVKNEKSGDRAETPELGKELSARTDKYKKAKLVIEKTYIWTLKNLQKLDKIVEKTYKPSRYYMDVYPRESISEAFLKVIEIAQNQLVSIQPEEAERVMDNLERTQIDEEVKREEFVTRNARVKQSPNKRKKSREESVGGSSKGNTSRDESFDFVDDAGGEHETVEDFNEDENDLEKMRIDIRVSDAREKELLRKKKLAEKKEKDGTGK